MPKYGAGKVLFLIDGYDILGAKPQKVSHKIINITERSDGVNDQWPEHTPVGMREAELVQEGALWDTSVNNIHDAFKAATPNAPQDALRVGVVGFGDNAIGSWFIGFEKLISAEYEALSTRGALQRANAAHRVGGKAEDGVILHQLVAETAGLNTEGAGSVDNTTTPTQRSVGITSSSVANPSVITAASEHGLVTGDSVLISGHSGSTPSINAEHTVTVITATTFSIPVNVTVGGTGGTFVKGKTASGGAGYLQVKAITLGGYTDVLVKVRHSADDSTYADLLSFAVVTARSAQRVTVAGTVNRHLAHSMAFEGAGSGPSVTYMVGFARF